MRCRLTPLLPQAQTDRPQPNGCGLFFSARIPRIRNPVLLVKATRYRDPRTLPCSTPHSIHHGCSTYIPFGQSIKNVANLFVCHASNNLSLSYHSVHRPRIRQVRIQYSAHYSWPKITEFMFTLLGAVAGAPTVRSMSSSLNRVIIDDGQRPFWTVGMHQSGIFWVLRTASTSVAERPRWPLRASSPT